MGQIHDERVIFGRMNRLFFGLILALSACSPRFHNYKSLYQHESRDTRPDYSKMDHWAAHPWKWDPSDSIPRPLLAGGRKDSLADVFFLHPTTYTKKVIGENASINDWYINAKTDYTSILYQASVFNEQCRVFAPRYRQASIKVFFYPKERSQEAAFETAYLDIKTAFEYYLEHWNHGRPIIIAGHSQGAKFAQYLLRDYFENKPLAKQLVVAYIPGWSLPKELFSALKVCDDSLQTGCVCSWRTMRRGYVPSYLRFEEGNSLVTNPLTWSSGGEYASRKLNKGSVLYKFNKIYRATTDGQVSNGFLYVRRPRFPWGFLYFSRNYHAGDFNLYYLNVRENIRQRIRVFNGR